MSYCRYMAATDLEPTGSRRIIPWFDEPGFKANMTLHIAREPGRIVTANMPIQSQGDPV
jgi:aminopeptidase N